MNPKYYFKRQIRDRGWTNKAIKRFLGEPDLLGVSHKFYLAERVYKAEKTLEFKSWKMTADIQRAQAKKILEGKLK